MGRARRHGDRSPSTPTRPAARPTAPTDYPAGAGAVREPARGGRRPGRQRDQLRLRGRRRQRGRRGALDAGERRRDAGRSACGTRGRQRRTAAIARRSCTWPPAATAGRRSPTTATSAAPTAARPGSPSTTRSRPRRRAQIDGLTNGTSYTCRAAAANAQGVSPAPPPRARSSPAPTRSNATRRFAGSCSASRPPPRSRRAAYLIGWYRNRLRPYITAYVDDSEAIPLGRGPRTGIAFVGNEIHADAAGTRTSRSSTRDRRRSTSGRPRASPPRRSARTSLSWIPKVRPTP